MTYTLHHHRQLCDSLTPVQAYLLLRDEGACSTLFESTDYHSREDAHSVVAIKPLESLSLLHQRRPPSQVGFAERREQRDQR